MLNKVKEEFIRLFGEQSQVRYFFSPGRVNIIGEHIDYNGGYVLPCAIHLGTYFAICKNQTTKVRAYSIQFESQGMIEFDLKDHKKNKKWTDYIKGIIQIFHINFGFDVVIGGNIPHSSGLSSSASFCTGLSFALESLQNNSISRVDLALMCKRVENEFMGVNCGIMDQFIICNGKEDYAILLDCDHLDFQYIPFNLKEYGLVIANTNKSRQLTDSKYNERKQECEEILQILFENGYSLNHLCDIKKDIEKYLALLPQENLKKRFKHVITENLRTIQAAQCLKEGNIEKLGELLTASHLSLENDYEVTGKELDTLVHSFLNQKGCIGARMTGAGFGGCAIALIEKANIELAKEKVKEVYTQTIGYEPSFYEVTIGDGVKEVK